MTGLLPSATARGDTATAAAVARPVSLSGLGAALRAAVLGLLAVMVLVLVGWATAADSGASASAAVRSALQVWLVAHHAELVVPGGRFQLVPLGLTCLPAALLFTAGARAARASAVARLRGAAALTAVLSATYAVLGAVLALVASNGAVRPSPISAFLGSGALALLAGGAGVLRASGRRAALWGRIPAAARLTGAGAAGALVTLLAGGSLLAGASLAGQHERAEALMRGLDPGLFGGLLVVLLCVAYVPTAAVWGAALALGPGFTVGVGTSVTLGGVEAGALPPLPLLAGLPAEQLPRWVVATSLLLPVVAGAVCGLLVERHDRAEPRPLLQSWRSLTALGSAAGATAGLVFGVIAAVASGPAGPGRLGDVGPSPWLVGLAAAAEVGLVAAATLVVRRWDLVRAGRRAAVTG